MFNRKEELTYQFLQQGHDPVVVLLPHSSYSFKPAKSCFLFAFEYINAVEAWTTFAGMFCKPEQVTVSFPFIRCDKALDALRCLKNQEPP
jgi:hypothetical protein